MHNTASLTLADNIRRSEQVLSQDDAGQAVLLDLAGERYFGLNKVGTRVWQLLGTTASLANVHAALCGEFDAAPETIAQDLLSLATQLQDAGLIERA